MHGIDFLLTSGFPSDLSAVLLGYTGLGPGQEFIPYFFALVAMIASALLAMFQRVFSAIGGNRSKEMNMEISPDILEPSSNVRLDKS